MIQIPISIGELIDKLTILQIKLQQIDDPEKWKNVKNEWDILFRLPEYKDVAYEIAPYFTNLYVVNMELWKIEDDIRGCEKNQNFDLRFIQLARSVLHWKPKYNFYDLVKEMCNEEFKK